MLEGKQSTCNRTNTFWREGSEFYRNEPWTSRPMLAAILSAEWWTKTYCSIQLVSNLVKWTPGSSKSVIAINKETLRKGDLEQLQQLQNSVYYISRLEMAKRSTSILRPIFKHFSKLCGASIVKNRQKTLQSNLNWQQVKRSTIS